MKYNTIDEIKKVYEELESEFHGHVFDIPELKINLTCEVSEGKIHYIPTVELVKKEENQKPKSLEDVMRDNAIKTLPLQYDVECICEVTGEGYNSSFENYIYYIYWRTQLRKGIIIITPLIYFRMYIKEICGMLWHDLPHKALQELIEIRKMYNSVTELDIDNKWSILGLLDRAIEGIKIYYSGYFPKSDVIDTLQMNKGIIASSDTKYILNGNYSKAFDYFVENSNYKLKSSKFYQSNEDLYKKAFIGSLPEVISYFIKHDMDIISLWIGKLEESSHKDNIFNYQQKEMITKQSFKVFDNLTVCIDEKGIHYQMNKPMDVHSPLYQRRDVMSYYLWSLEAVLREQTGFRAKLKPSVTSLRRKVKEYATYGSNFKNDVDFYTKLADLYESPDFTDMLQNSVSVLLSEEQ